MPKENTLLFAGIYKRISLIQGQKTTLIVPPRSRRKQQKSPQTQNQIHSAQSYSTSSSSPPLLFPPELELMETRKSSDSGEAMVLNGARNWRRRRKRKKERNPDEAEAEKGNSGESEVRRDPLEVLGRDIMLIILNNLDARSVALSLVVSRGWHGVASSDKLWSAKCEELWMGKAHIPRISQMRGISKLAAYSLSIMDSKRTRIMKEDLCDHAWEFHFNKAAPEYWRNLDPYWKGTGPPLRRYFHPDGSQTADPDDKVWGGHEGCFSTVTSFVGEGRIRAHYVRINRWPQMSVSRKPDWGWEMSNHFCCYSSIPDAKKEGGTGPLFLCVNMYV